MTSAVSKLAQLAQENGGVVKVCGITNLNDAELALELGADLIGLVLAADSPRAIEVHVAAEIIMGLEGRCPTVAVLGDVSAPEAEALVRIAGFDWVQLCGEANPVYFHNFPVPILRRISASEDGAAEMKRWSKFADGYVIEKAGTMGGGGQIADWDVAQGLSKDGACLLAGGLKAENVADAIQKVVPLGVDASSSLEQEIGLKSEEAMEAFIGAARTALTEEESS